jgi:hypothetical protein
MTDWLPGISKIYLWGVFGSFAIEIATIYQSVRQNDGVLQAPFTRPAYIVFRILLALIAGVIPEIANVTTALAAVYMGASAPLYFDRISRGLPPLPER